MGKIFQMNNEKRLLFNNELRLRPSRRRTRCPSTNVHWSETIFNGISSEGAELE